MKILSSVVTGADPYFQAAVDGVDLCGPTVSLGRRGAYDGVVLWVPEGLENRGRETAVALRHGQPGLPVLTIPFQEQDIRPAWIADAMKSAPGRIRSGCSADEAEWVIALSRTFPALHEGLVEVTRTQNLRAAFVQPRRSPYPGPVHNTEESVAFLTAEHTLNPASARVRESGAAYAAASAPNRPAASDADARLTDTVARLGIQAGHPAMAKVLDAAAALAGHPVPVLIQGETGTGKGLLARLIHELSGRANRRFVAVNCAALPAQLIESLLFGHKKGAFTGAASDQIGKFQAADGGTLFLDEVGELPLELQPKLLKVLEDGIVEPVGSHEGVEVRVRVLAATNRDLKTAVAEKTFREDLYYRLSFAVIDLPPLRERRSDIPPIALRVLDRINQSLRQPKRLTTDALRMLEGHAWPGNIRDLENAIGRSVLLTRADILGPDDLLIDGEALPDAAFAGLPDPCEGFDLESYLDGARRRIIRKALDRSGGNQSAAARILGISPQAVHSFVKKTQRTKD